MKIAIVGSRGIDDVDLSEFVTAEDEIVSGGAIGVDRCAAQYAREHGLKLTEFLPEYKLYGRAAPILRNRRIVAYADKIVAFWDGRSRGTLSTIQFAQELGKPFEVVMVRKPNT